ncbi:MAG: hypothetical protein Q9198_001174 [Flavoplaca austrocitrina]
MEHNQELTSPPRGSVYLAPGFAVSNNRINEGGIQERTAAAGISTRAPGLQRQLSTIGQQVETEIRQKPIEARAFIGSEYNSDSSDEDDVFRPMAHSFTKRVLPIEWLMPTIIEERQSSTIDMDITFRVTIRSNSIHARTNVQKSTLPETFDQAKLEARIAQLDEYLDTEAAVRTCYRERLWRIREAFKDLRAHWDQRDIPRSLKTLSLDLEVQVACQAHENVGRFTHLLLHANVSEDIKRKLRRYLAHSETLTDPRLDGNSNLVHDHLKAMATSIENMLATESPETTAASAVAKASGRKRDTDDLQAYLQHMLLLRYDRNEYPPRLNIKNLKPLGKYLRWKATRDKDSAASLAKKLALHPVELEYVMQERLDSLLQRSQVEPGYIQARLRDLGNVWRWVNEYNSLARIRQWATLARQFSDDQAQFDRIFPGDLTFRDPGRGILESSTKARVRFGMIRMHTYYFAKLRSPDNYKLSANTKSMDKRFARVDQQRLRERKAQQEQQRLLSSNGLSPQQEEGRRSSKSQPFTTLRSWAQNAKDCLKSQSKGTRPEENQ